MLLTIPLALAACGGDDIPEVVQQARFCDLAGQLDTLAAGTGAASAPLTYDGPPAAFARLLEQMGGTVDELRTTAPDEVSGDVDTVVEAMAAAGDGDAQATRSPSFTEAVQQLAAYRQASCPAGDGGSGEQ